MTKAVRAIPEGYQTVTPYIIVKSASEAIPFYQKAFGVIELARMAQPDGKICHAEILFGTSRLMLADEFVDMNLHSATTIGGSPISLHVYVENVDELFAQAIAAGAEVVRPVTNQFYGDRSGMLRDPFGLVWNISTHVEDVTIEEINKRYQEFSKEKCC